ncbi:MAG: porin family protein [Rhodospirillales bacterium]|nr:MAG: porin family protein [Rhodospirillales bacterium]
MRASIPAAIFASFLLYIAPAAAQEASEVDSGLYVSARILGSNPTAKDDPTGAEYQLDYGYGGIAAIGYAAANPGYGVNFRFEIEASYRTYELSEISDPSTTICGGVTFCLASGNYNIAAAMANIYFDFSTGSAILPSVGLGYGRARHYLDDWVINGVPVPNDHLDTDIFQVMAGFGYKITPGLILDTEYRYVQPNDSSMNGFFSNELNIGLRLIL